MKKALILLALAGVAASACGGDDGGSSDKPSTGSKDASVGADATVARPQQIGDHKVGIACTTATQATDCSGGAGAGTCLTTVTLMQQSLVYEGGYCSIASCEASSECGAGAMCPTAEVIAGLPSAVTTLLATFGGPSALSAIFPANCYATCNSNSDCRTSDGYACSTLADLFNNGGAATTGGIGGQLSQFTSGKAFQQGYCLPPLPAGDGGVAPAGDAGTKALVLNGLDAGL